MKKLLSTNAAVTIVAGLTFAHFPHWVFFVFGEPLDSSVGIRGGHIVGAALMSLGVACQLGRNESRSHAPRWIMALLLYHAGFVFSF